MELNIDVNYHNGGLYCLFEVNEQEYFADLCLVPYSDYTECMIFKTDGDHQLTLKNAQELYCKRHIPVTREELTKCVEEFIKDLNKKDN